jgi:hypothetical protein
VGLDGVSALLGAARVRCPSAALRTGIGTIAPEILAGTAADQRADVYSLGALLWQALSGKPLFPDDNVEAILAGAKEGTVPRATVSKDLPWAAPLADVAARALAAPDQRFPTASSMITEVRKIAGPKLATAVQVAEFVEAVAGEKIAARLADVHASVVIRKPTSIPPPRSAPEKVPEIVGRESGPSQVAAPLLVSGPPKVPGRKMDEPAKVLTPPVDRGVSKLPMREDSESNVATLAFLAPAAPRTAPAAAPRTAPPAAPPATPRAAPPAAPPAPPARSVKPAKVTAERAAVVHRPRVAPKASLAVPEVAPSSSPLARWGVRVALGISLAIAVTTGWYALQAIRNRQVIVTPGAVLQEPPKVPAPVASTLADKAGAGRAGPVSTAKKDTARATTPTAGARGVTALPAPAATPSAIPRK